MSSDDGQLELTELRRRFGVTVAPDGLTFTVPRGQVFGFLGLAGTVYGRAILRTGSRLKVRQVLRSGRLTALVDIELWQKCRSPGRQAAARKHGT